MPQRNCSRDSVASKPYIPPGECCPTIPSFCTCDYDKCKHGCDQHSTKKELILKGEGVPGKCCDHFKCVPASDTQEKEADLK
ncbi:hypothetical protein NDU88_010600 [Pleurodeles waltl]|uniref:Uncharacterized protein n=1 Tax=Pleurodeles waltl TaxID=8319 RepID=A0AAV7QWC3_PLEWA|nr:hypothetical protein NDU88_010600 [Pleurodeles waltl]